MLEQYAKKASYPFASVAAEFKLIENETKTIVIGKEPEAEKITQRLRFGEHSRELMRDVGQYSVQIYKDAYEKLRAQLDIWRLWKVLITNLRYLKEKSFIKRSMDCKWMWGLVMPFLDNR